jgi:hypothetical protein
MGPTLRTAAKETTLLDIPVIFNLIILGLVIVKLLNLVGKLNALMILSQFATKVIWYASSKTAP